VEARLTDLTCDTSVHPDAALRQAIAIEPPAEAAPPQGELLARIDRYLRTAGAADATQRSRLTVATARDLLAQGTGAEPAWAEIIAAVDRSLAAELAGDAGDDAPPRSRGRVALGLAGAVPAGSDAAIFGNAWGTPPRRPYPMRAQDLALWRPSAERLQWLQLSRPVQGLAACLCWLAVLMVP